MRGFQQPEVRTDVPLPPAPHDGRTEAAKHRVFKPSPWVAFLKSLPVGASFECNYWEQAAVKRWSKKAGVQVEWRRNLGERPNGAYYRIWITGSTEA